MCVYEKQFKSSKLNTSNTLKYVISDDNIECEAGTTSTCKKRLDFSKYVVEYLDSSLNEYIIAV